MAVTSPPNREEKPVQAKRVAVIGAGVSGVVTAKHMKASGLDVVVFERSKQAGGNWSVGIRKSMWTHLLIREGCMMSESH
jgi:cation diffusion facilitator CzcD-associated flavoprotein CzcO